MSYEHKNIQPNGQHVIHRWEITATEELDTINVSVNELHKLALDINSNTYYKLSNVTPVVWTKLNYIPITDFIPSEEKGAVNGVAPLDATGKVDSAYLPATSTSVNSVNGQTGVVVLTNTDVGAIASTEKGSANGVAPLGADSRISSEHLPLLFVTTVNDQSGAVTIPVPDANTTIQGNTFNGVNQLVKLDANGKLPAIDGSQLINVSKPRYVSLTANNIDLSLGEYFSKEISGATTLTISNISISPLVSDFVIRLINAGTNITWWSGIKWAGGTAPVFSTSGIDIVYFYTEDSGTTWYGICSKGFA